MNFFQQYFPVRCSYVCYIDVCNDKKLSKSFFLHPWRKWSLINGVNAPFVAQTLNNKKLDASNVLQTLSIVFGRKCKQNLKFKLLLLWQPESSKQIGLCTIM